MPPVWDAVQEVMEVRDGWRRVHPEQPLGGLDGCRTRQHRGGGLKSTTGGCRGASSAWNGPKLVGGSLQRKMNK